MKIARFGTMVLLCSLVWGTLAHAQVKPWQWTPAQASSALRQQAEDFYVETTADGSRLPRDLAAAACRGTGKRVAGRFVSFSCQATVSRGLGDPALALRVAAKTRRAGGLCWAVAPAPVPAGCMAAGRRSLGSVSEAFRALVRVVGTTNQDVRCIPHGAGFFSCTWLDAVGAHRGTVVFSPGPVVKVVG